MLDALDVAERVFFVFDPESPNSTIYDGVRKAFDKLSTEALHILFEYVTEGLL